MKKGMILSCLCLAAVFGTATVANAGSSSWQFLMHTSVAQIGPGPDGLMGTGDDVADPRNFDIVLPYGDGTAAFGAYSVSSIEFDPADPTCDPLRQPGPDNVGYVGGVFVACDGTPPGGFTVTYEDVRSTEALPGAGTMGVKLTPGGGPNTGTPCGLGPWNLVMDTTLYVAGLPVTTYDDAPLSGETFDATVSIPVGKSVTCAKVDGGSSTYTQADLESVRLKLPAGATFFYVACGMVQLSSFPIPCLSNAAAGNVLIAWTDGPYDCVSPCCDDDGDGYLDQRDLQCPAGADCNDANPGIYLGAPELQCNGVDEDCNGADSCGGSCTGAIP